MKKISRRSFLAAAGVSAAALALTACGGSSNSTAASTATSAAASTAPAGDAAAAASDPKVTLVYAEVNPLDTIVGQTGSHFKEKVEELTGGSVVVDVQASGVLGSENDVLDAILGGSTSIDISRISAFALTSYGCNKSKLLSIPFTFENRAHFWNFASVSPPPSNSSGVGAREVKQTRLMSTPAVDKASAMRCPKASSPSCVKREALPPCAA